MSLESFTTELRDKDGNLKLSVESEVKITPNGFTVIFDPMITVQADETLSVMGIYPLCPDCKDGYYYPLIGKREPCETCK